MTCNKEVNIKRGWNHYCSVIDKLAKLKYIGRYFKNDTIFGVYLGCICKEHDIQYSKEGTQYKIVADFLMWVRMLWAYFKKGRIISGILISTLMYLGVSIGGFIVWKTWSSKWAERYK